MKVTIRDPKPSRIFKTVHEVSDKQSSFVISVEAMTLGSFEWKVVRAKIKTQQHNKFHYRNFRNVMVHPCSCKSNSSFVSEDTLTSVGEDGIDFLALRTQTADERIRIREQTVVGKAVLTNFVLNSIPIEDNCDAWKLSAGFLNQMHRNLDMYTSLELSSFAETFSSSIEISEIVVSENEKRQKTDPQLLMPIPGADLSSVLSCWGKRQGINW